MKNAFCIIILLIVNFLNAQADFTISEVKINSFINGTLLTPNGIENPHLAIIIPGSGPTDRDGNQQLMRNNSLKKLAEELTKNDIATFRYDKRIFTLLRQNALREEDLRFEDFVTDAVSVIQYFQNKGYESITLIGHSQGALVAKLAAAQTPVSQVVSLTGAGKSIDQVIVDQLAVEAPDLRDDAENAFRDLRETGKAEKFSPGLLSVLRPAVQPFMKSWMLYDPVVAIADIEDIPVLIITGTKDLQVREEEGQLLAKARPDARYVIIERMNHVLKEIEGDELENSKAYNEPYRPVSPQLISEITEFIKQ